MNFEKDLILVEDNLLFNKSSQKNMTDILTKLYLAETILKNCKFGDLVYKIGDQYKIVDRKKALELPECDDWYAECCASAKDMADGMPRFILGTLVEDPMDNKKNGSFKWTEKHEDKVIHGINCIDEHIDDTVYNDIYGWEHTNVLLGYDSPMAKECKKLNEDLYIPSVGECIMVYLNIKKGYHYVGIIGSIWTSSLASDQWAVSFEIPENSKLPYSPYILDYTHIILKYFSKNVLPFLHLTPTNIIIGNKTNESYDFNKKLMSFDDIQFNKSYNKLQNTKKTIDLFYGFKDCRYGDKIYYDEKLQYNLLDGEYMGFCCLEANTLDGNPRFVYKEDIGKMTWNTAMLKCQEIPNGYLPKVNELKWVKPYLKNTYYWTSTILIDNESSAKIIEGLHGYFGTYPKNEECMVRPFINVANLEKYNDINESIDLMQVSDEDDISFNKSNKDMSSTTKKGINTIYDFNNCKFGDKIYYDEKLGGYNLYEGEYMGSCVIESDGENDVIFIANEIIDEPITFQAALETMANKNRNKKFFAWYIPSFNEIQQAYDNGYNFLEDEFYWIMPEKYSKSYIHSNQFFYNHYDGLHLAESNSSDVSKLLMFFVPVNFKNGKILHESELILFNDSDDIEFNKSKNTLNLTNQKAMDNVFGFDRCVFGDKIYYNDELGYNLLDGEYMGFCCIEAYQLSEFGLGDNPRFAFREDLVDNYDWETAIINCKKEFNLENGYLPTIDEINIALKNGLSDYLIDYTTYWTSSDIDEDGAIGFDSYHKVDHPYSKSETLCARPFISLPTKLKKLEESQLIQMDSDDIEFSKSHNSLDQINDKVINRTLYNFLNCVPGDKVYKDEVLGFNLMEGEYIGDCVIQAGIVNDYPSFAYKFDQEGYHTWNKAKGMQCRRMTKQYGCEFYLPSFNEMLYAIKNNNLKLLHSWYWTSTTEGKPSSNKSTIRMISSSGFEMLRGSLLEVAVRLFFNPLKNINESHILQFDDNDIHFGKSSKTLNNISKTQIDKNMYDFDNCKVGDKVYYDEVCGINLLEGEYIGQCAIEANTIDLEFPIITTQSNIDGLFPNNKYPIFAWKEDCEGFYNFKDALKMAKTLSRQYGINAVIPNIDVLRYANEISNVVKLDNTNEYNVWSITSPTNNNDGIYTINTVKTWVLVKNKSSMDSVFKLRIFFTIDNHDIKKGINENKINLIQFDDEIEFNKSSLDIQYKLRFNDALFNEIMLNCKLNDKVYLINGKFKISEKEIEGLELVGVCCATANQFKDGMPRFCIHKYFASHFTISKADQLPILLNEVESVPELKYATSIEDCRHNIIDGWNNSEILLKIYNSPAVSFVKETNINYYIPSSSEAFIMGLNYHLLDYYLTSTFAYSYNRELKILAYSPRAVEDFYGATITEPILVIPFIHITPLNLINDYKNNITESFDFNKELIQFDNNDIEFSKSNLDVISLRNTKDQIRINTYENAQIGDFVYYNEAINKFKISKSKIRERGFIRIGHCCITAELSYDNAPKFMTTKSIGNHPWLFYSRNLKNITFGNLLELSDDGWTNTNKLRDYLSNLQYSSAAIEAVKDVNENYYIPSYFEIRQIYWNNFIKQGIFMTSNQYNTWQNACYHIEKEYQIKEYEGAQSDYRVWPMIHITLENLA